MVTPFGYISCQTPTKTTTVIKSPAQDYSYYLNMEEQSKQEKLLNGPKIIGGVAQKYENNFEIKIAIQFFLVVMYIYTL